MAMEQTAEVFVFAGGHIVRWVWLSLCSIYCAQGHVYTRTRPLKLFKFIPLMNLLPKYAYRLT